MKRNAPGVLSRKKGQRSCAERGQASASDSGIRQQLLHSLESRSLEVTATHNTGGPEDFLLACGRLVHTIRDLLVTGDGSVAEPRMTASTSKYLSTLANPTAAHHLGSHRHPAPGSSQGCQWQLEAEAASRPLTPRHWPERLPAAVGGLLSSVEAALTLVRLTGWPAGGGVERGSRKREGQMRSSAVV
ncbi:hypothetical protein HaLaN_12099 [Haematococcus lacustris]|uniref:Uncharacterized protein n=1 Tax=Haematococcus lacustris TaxID=44745 RepID=A0A699Z977_HAELA|nr:hypothetical protein HaLaN_12099 [Haematococcus lacustris]